MVLAQLVLLFSRALLNVALIISPEKKENYRYSKDCFKIDL